MAELATGYASEEEIEAAAENFVAALGHENCLALSDSLNRISAPSDAVRALNHALYKRLGGAEQ